MTTILTANNITKSYGKLQVLKGISLEIAKGELVAIVGASGAGKSTLLHILGTLDKADGGTLEVTGQNVLKMGNEALAKFRNQQVGFVFQFHNLLPEFTALENACMPALIGGLSMQEASKRGKELFDLLGISHRMEHKPSELSGGEQQRVAVARALVNRPAIVFADEPSGNLDVANADELHRLFFRLRDEMQQTFVVVTHNPAFAALADRRLEMKEGKLAV